MPVVDFDTEMSW